MATVAPSPNPRRRVAAASVAPYLFVGGATLYLLFFTIVPMVRGLWFSFTDATLLNPDGASFIGTENYTGLLADGGFYSSLLTTLLYTAGTVLGSLVIGTVAAVALSERIRGRAVFRAILTIPWAVPSIAAVLVFIWIFNVESGVANRATQALGIGAQGWLLDPKLGLLSVTLVSVWKVFPFVMLVMLAALQSVPGELREAARVDGAGRLNVFRTVTLPHIVPTMRIVALLMTIWSIRRFEVIYLLTGGGPVDSTNTIVISVYREAFQNSQLGQAAALGMLGLCLSTIVTVIYFLFDRRDARKDAR